MAHGALVRYPITMASGATLTPSLDLNRSWATAYLLIASGFSNTQIFIKGSADNSSFYRITHPSINSSTVTTNDFAIHSAATGRMVPIPTTMRYIKLETANSVDDGASFNILVGDE